MKKKKNVLSKIDLTVKEYEIWLLFLFFFFFLPPWKEFSEGVVFSCVCDFVLFYFFCYHDNSWKAQPIRTKFSHKTFERNSLAMYENGLLPLPEN